MPVLRLHWLQALGCAGRLQILTKAYKKEHHHLPYFTDEDTELRKCSEATGLLSNRPGLNACGMPASQP
jgi:hypothetical protein